MGGEGDRMGQGGEEGKEVGPQVMSLREGVSVFLFIFFLQCFGACVSSYLILYIACYRVDVVEGGGDRGIWG